jgi:hypothetical protein
MKIAIVVTLAMFPLLEGFGGESPHPGACKADVERLCKGVKPGGGRIIRCVKEHEADLSTECKEAMAEARQEIREWAQACEPDVQKFCKDAKPGGGRILRCLGEHEAELAPACKAALPKKKG